VIEFRLTRLKIVQLGNEVHVSNFVLGKLRELGVPVVGVLCPRIETGTLIVKSDDLATDDYIYRWTPE
jgi:hypothetical protein